MNERKLNFLEKLHYSTLKEIHLQNFIIDHNDMPNPSASEIVRGIEAREKLRTLHKQECKLRVRLFRVKKQEQ